MDSPPAGSPPWEGLHHVALVAPELDATVAFHRDVPGMEVGEVRSGGGVLAARHCFVRPGASASTGGLRFFEHPGAEIPRSLGGLRSPGLVPGALQLGAAVSRSERLHAGVGPAFALLFLSIVGLSGAQLR